MNFKYGYFDKNGSEFVTNRPDTPRAYDNFIWNESAFSNLQQTGVGCFDYQPRDKEAIQLFTGVGRICDYDIFGRDHLMSRIIYIRDNKSKEFWTVNWEPVKKETAEFECTHGMGYTIIKNITNEIKSTFRVFMPIGEDPVELWTLNIENIGKEKRDLSIFIYNQIQFKYKWDFDSYGDMVYRSVWMDKKQNAVFASKHPYLKPHEFLTAFLTSDTEIKSFDGSQKAFIGLYDNLSAPKAVVDGKCSNTQGSAEATIMAAHFNLELNTKLKKEINIIVGATDCAERVEAISDKYFGEIANEFEKLNRNNNFLLTKNTVKTPDEQFDNLFNWWIKQATRFGAYWGRWGYSGYRDIVQHGLGVASFEPERTKIIIQKALRYQFSSGMAVRGWNPIDEKAYSDCALWLVFTIVSYIKETGDIAFLDEIIPFYDKGEATVFTHIDKALSFLEANKGARNMLLIKFGDWNDSLTGTGKGGRGESVWLSMAYAQALAQMADLASYIDNDLKRQNYLERRKNIINAVNDNAWESDRYIRCIDDDDNPVGSKINEKGKIFFEPQCWALISGIADEKRAEIIIDTCNKELGTELGYMLLSPVYTEFDSNIGRISSMEPGVAENGTVYSHLNIWMVLGLLRIGKANEAYELFKKISPGYIDKNNNLKENALPFMYSNCYFGPDHKNSPFEMEFSWITGSVAWYNYVIVNEMMGARADFDGLIIDPRLPSSWKNCEVKRQYRGCNYIISIDNTNGYSGKEAVITIDGNLIKGNKIPILEDGSTHLVQVIIP